MEMDAVNVARHKLFRGKPSFVDKKMDGKKSVFGELSIEEIQKIMDNAVPVATKRPLSERVDYLTVRIR